MSSTRAPWLDDEPEPYEPGEIDLDELADIDCDRWERRLDRQQP